MAIDVGVGKSNELDAFTAGRSAAEIALDKAGVEKCDFVFLFSTIDYNQEAMLKGVRSVTGDAPLSGCSAEGLITQDGPEGEVEFALSGAERENSVVGVMVFASDEIILVNFVECGLKDNSCNVGEKIGEKINDIRGDDSRILFMFPDAYEVNTHKLFCGIKATMKQPLLYCGGASAHNQSLSQVTYQYHNDKVLKNALPCVLLSGNINVEIGVNHGCIPIGTEKKVTKAKDNVVFEVENSTAWKFYQEYLGDDIEQLNSEFAPSLSFGVKLPDTVSTEYDNYILRAPLISNPDGSIIFPAEIEEGTNVQLMRRDEEKISYGAKKMAQQMKEKLKSKNLIAILHFDCAGRGKMFFGDDVKEKSIDVLQNQLGKEIPWLGFFCFGEIAPIKGRNYFHNQTVVLCAIYQ